MLHTWDMPIAYRWHPITDLPDGPKNLTEGELDSLMRVWEKQKEDLVEQGILKQGILNEFEKRLRREWVH